MELSRSITSKWDIASWEKRWKVITSFWWTVSGGPGFEMFVTAHPQPAGALKLPYKVMLTAPAGLLTPGAEAAATGADPAKARMDSPIATSSNVFVRGAIDSLPLSRGEPVPAHKGF